MADINRREFLKASTVAAAMPVAGCIARPIAVRSLIRLALKREHDPDEVFQSNWYRHYRGMFELLVART